MDEGLRIRLNPSSPRDAEILGFFEEARRLTRDKGVRLNESDLGRELLLIGIKAKRAGTDNTVPTGPAAVPAASGGIFVDQNTLNVMIAAAVTATLSSLGSVSRPAVGNMSAVRNETATFEPQSNPQVKIPVTTDEPAVGKEPPEERQEGEESEAAVSFMNQFS